MGHEENVYLPRVVPDLPRVRQAALGGLHTVVLTCEGEVHTCGYGGFGALGHGGYGREKTLKKVEGLEGVVHVAAGGAHSGAVTESGSVYTWGRDEGDHRLGHPWQQSQFESESESDSVPRPSEVSGLPSTVRTLALGGFFSAALTCHGQIWTWGEAVGVVLPLWIWEGGGVWRWRLGASMRRLWTRVAVCGPGGGGVTVSWVTPPSRRREWLGEWREEGWREGKW